MEFYIDEDSFGRPYDQAQKDVSAACKNPARTVHGSANRADNAELAAGFLKQFADRVDKLIKDGSFDELPRLRRGFQRVTYFRHLTVGMWRGVFLVSPENNAAIALIFSREPHDYVERLDELVGIEDCTYNPSNLHLSRFSGSN